MKLQLQIMWMIYFINHNKHCCQPFEYLSQLACHLSFYLFLQLMKNFEVNLELILKFGIKERTFLMILFLPSEAQLGITHICLAIAMRKCLGFSDLTIAAPLSCIVTPSVSLL